MSNQLIVTVFGAGRAAPDSALYAQSRELGRALAEAGYAVATGGYGGVMEGVSRGAREAGGHVIGVTCTVVENFRGVTRNPWVVEEVRFDGLRERLYHLIQIGHALVAMPGGVGTLGEIAAAWNGLQTGEVPRKPLVLVGAQWRQTLDVFLGQMDGLVAPRDVALLDFVSGPQEAIVALGGRIQP
jgi:uncharacterized protein (TIGR00730 family)